MKNVEFISHSEEETITLASQIASFLNSGDVITLEGDLGAGKTTFTKGIAKQLGVRRAVTSPTFTIIKEYEGDIRLYHIDAYRLEDSEEDLGFDEYLYGDGISVVEWARFIDDFLPEERLEISIERLDDSTRKIVVTALGRRYEKIIANLRNMS